MAGKKAQVEPRTIQRADVLEYLEGLGDNLSDPGWCPSLNDAEDGMNCLAREEMIRTVYQAELIVRLVGPDEKEA